ncbi:MAG: hypothetical protein WCX17_00485 [Parcubacteria group bacterium]|jgi:hypothetical protein
MIRIFKDGVEVIKENNSGEKGESIVKEVLLMPVEETFKKAVNVRKRPEEDRIIGIPKGELVVIRRAELVLEGCPPKTIIIGVLSRALTVEEVKKHRIPSKECPYNNECNRRVALTKISSFSCTPCEVFQNYLQAGKTRKN